MVSHIHGDHFYLENIKKLSPKNLYLSHECLEVIGEENLSAKITEVKNNDSFLIDEIGSIKEAENYLKTKYNFEPEVCW